MTEVRRRRRSGTSTTANGTTPSTAPVEELDLTNQGRSVTATPVPKPIAETIAAEKATARLLTFAGLLLGTFFIYLGLYTDIPRKDVSYAVMIDAGSTGTRAQVFSFKNGALLDTKMFSAPQPLAALGYASGTGASFFKPLLDDVRTAIPGAKRRQSVPMALRATGGLRTVGLDFAERVLAEARTALKASGFLVRDEWVSLLEGQSDGVGAWTTSSFLRGHFNGSVAESAGVVELGGASLQLVFEGNADALAAAEESHRAAKGTLEARPLLPRMTSLNVGGSMRKLISMSRQGMGMTDFRKKLYLLFDREGVLKEQNPCFRNGKVFEKKKVLLGTTGNEESRVVTINGMGNFENCVASAEIVLAHYGPLDSKVLARAPMSDIYAYAYIFDRTVGLGLPESPTKEELVKKGQELCEGSGEIKGDFDEACAEFSYVYLLLRQITNDFAEGGPKVKLVQYVDGHMLGWALGTVLGDFQQELASQID